MFGSIAGRSAAEYAKTLKHIPDASFRIPFPSGASSGDHKGRMARLRTVADSSLFVICSESGLRRALAELEKMKNEPVCISTLESVKQAYEWKNAFQTAELVVKASLRRTGTLGVFCREDKANG